MTADILAKEIVRLKDLVCICPLGMAPRHLLDCPALPETMEPKTFNLLRRIPGGFKGRSVNGG